MSFPKYKYGFVSFSPEFHDLSGHTGSLVAVDTFMVVSLKGVGRVYLQFIIDCHSRYAFWKLYTNKLTVTAVHVLNEDVLPFFEEHFAGIKTILSDNGREFCKHRIGITTNCFCSSRALSIGPQRIYRKASPHASRRAFSHSRKEEVV